MAMKICGKCGGRMLLEVSIEGEEWWCFCGNREPVGRVSMLLGFAQTKGKGFHKFQKAVEVPLRRGESGGNGRFGEEVELQEGLDALEMMMGRYVI